MNEMPSLKLNVQKSIKGEDKINFILNKLAEILDRKISLEDWAQIEKIITKDFKNEPKAIC